MFLSIVVISVILLLLAHAFVTATLRLWYLPNLNVKVTLAWIAQWLIQAASSVRWSWLKRPLKYKHLKIHFINKCNPPRRPGRKLRWNKSRSSDFKHQWVACRKMKRAVPYIYVMSETAVAFLWASWFPLFRFFFFLWRPSGKKNMKWTSPARGDWSLSSVSVSGRH